MSESTPNFVPALRGKVTLAWWTRPDGHLAVEFIHPVGVDDEWLASELRSLAEVLCPQKP